MNLFESLGIASVEKMHTQFLYWFFNNGNIPSKLKVSLLNNLFNQSLTSADVHIFAISEIDKIDLLITTGKAVFLIENKIKSSEHSLQTQRYTVPSNYKSMPAFYCFLTLINENPKNEEYISRVEVAL